MSSFVEQSRVNSLVKVLEDRQSNGTARFTNVNLELGKSSNLYLNVLFLLPCLICAPLLTADPRLEGSNPDTTVTGGGCVA
jgi:hypothetical protein